ncbi:ABC transporter substrate-binding protein [Jiangella asiatica]|uniref:Extracellular solute-binding protein n=1 Tax=Jiangella asiatica TaxID=2530372 RepID=A0A4R5CY50_9ACTN|nr:extracellular solute-binding protein [Jiangella asiatica]TDE02783.1 extracellular solute-binding protein [Jiangella asiatica]
MTTTGWRQRAQRARISTGCAIAGLFIAGCTAPGASTGGDDDGATSLTVWVDSTRTPGVERYLEEHPDVDIRMTTIPSDPGYVLTQISLANQADDGWPDVVFLNTPEDVASLAAPPFDFAAPLDELVDDEITDGFVEGSLSGCTFGDTLYCLRNDIGQTVLWYNQALMQEFGYEVPQTWSDYGALGERVAAEHPGYIIGGLNGKWGAGVYFESSGCPTRDVIDLTTVRIDTSDPGCVRAAELLDPLLANGSVSALSPSDPAFAQIGQENRILMLPAASWYGEHRFKAAYESPAGEMAAAPMPTWDGEDVPYSGSVGGGAFVVSRHAEDMDAAVDFATWMTTNVDHQSEQPTYPAFAEAAEAWGAARAADPFYAEDPFPVMKDQAPLIRDTFGWVRYANEWNNIFNETVVAAAESPEPLLEAVEEWGSRLTQAAEATDYEVAR